MDREAWNLKHKYELATRGLKTGALLDIGCGVGDFLHTAETQGWHCTGVEPSEEAKAIALKNSTESEERVIASKKEAAEIIATAKLTAENNRKESIEATQLEINKMKELAEEDIARSKEEAKEEIRQEMVSVALEASKEVLKREVNEKDNARIVQDFIKDMDK